MMRNSRRCVVIIAALAAVSLSLPLAGAQPHRGGLNPAPKELDLGGTAVTVPMHRYNGWAVVEAKVNGNGPFKFIVDTGAPGMFVDSRYKETMNLADHPKYGGMQVKVAGPGGGGGLPASLHLAESVRIGGAKLSELTVLALEMPLSKDIAGVIGMGVFKDCLLTFDYPASKMTFVRGELPPANGRDILDYAQSRQADSHPIISVDVAGRAVEFTLDTGMTGWIAFPKDVAEHCKLSAGPVRGPNGRHVDREIETSMVRLEGRVTFGDVVLENPHGAVLEDQHRSPLIGSRVLQEFALTLDQKNLRLRFARKSRAPIAPPALRVAGFSLRGKDEGFVVWGLMPDTPAAAAGLKNGDVVLTLNGQPAADIYGRPAWDKILKKSDKIQVRFKTSDQPKPRDIEVAVVTLLP